MLETKNISAGYGERDIIKDINLQAKRGEITAVIGPNGCGKTTLLKTLARLLPCRGSILLDGNDISPLPRKMLAKKIALLAQTTGVYFPYSVYDTAAMGRYPHLTSFLKNFSADDHEIIMQVLEKLGLCEVKDKLINELSGGQLQRVFLARSLVQNPDLILLDEPTNHLDLKHQIELLEYLALWAAENSRAVVAVLHDLNLARRYAHNAVLMNDGIVISSGACKSVLSGEALREAYGLDIRAFMLDSLQKWKGN